MRGRYGMPALLLLSLILGCGRSFTTPARHTSANGPHGGFAVPLPNQLGYAEVVIEVGTAPRGKEPDSQVVVYFLQPDLKTALAPLPSNASVKLLFPDKEPATVSLSPQPNPEDPAGTGRFASSPGPYLVDEPIGELTATVSGSPFRGSFTSTR